MKVVCHASILPGVFLLFFSAIAKAQLPLQQTNWSRAPIASKSGNALFKFDHDTLEIEDAGSKKITAVMAFRQIQDTLLVFNIETEKECNSDTGFYLIHYQHNAQEVVFHMIKDKCKSQVNLFNSSAAFEYVPEAGQPVRDWYFLDPENDSIAGISLYKAYGLLKGRKVQTVKVAVIDNGFDLDHEDLKNIMWTNSTEVPGNGLDDDRNGYIDDIHGWNFRGAKNGVTPENDQAEATRVYTLWKNTYDRADTSRLDQQQKKEWFEYQKAKKEYLAKKADPKASEADLKYYYNPDYNPRSGVDHPDSLHEQYYGIPLAKLPSSLSHGTHVAGIIAAERNNGIGIDGVADHVLIMPIVATTGGGDERDKDVANAIRYAVNNGARLINMSFSKAYSSNKKLVDDAIRYADQNNVLIFHSAGNDGDDDDTASHYPVGIYEDGNKASNFITVGWSRSKFDYRLAHPYSDYGKKNVDLFAPGSDILSTVPGNQYDEKSGTSMATPVVSGVAALLFSYFPTLTAAQVKDILLNSTYKPDILVNRPGSRQKVPFSSLSLTGGIVNAYNAIQMAIDITENRLLQNNID